tara:strand:+ start:272 stop:580 length:309 start_codon:yes stop_codon:yes gene_type:complete
MTDRETIQRVRSWTEDRGYLLLACLPIDDGSGALPSFAVLVEQPEPRRSEQILRHRYVAWTAVIMDNGDIAMNWGHYHYSFPEAYESLTMKAGVDRSIGGGR